MRRIISSPANRCQAQVRGVATAQAGPGGQSHWEGSLVGWGRGSGHDGQQLLVQALPRAQPRPPPPTALLAPNSDTQDLLRIGSWPLPWGHYPPSTLIILCVRVCVCVSKATCFPELGVFLGICQCGLLEPLLCPSHRENHPSRSQVMSSFAVDVGRHSLTGSPGTFPGAGTCPSFAGRGVSSWPRHPCAPCPVNVSIRHQPQRHGMRGLQAGLAGALGGEQC